MKGRIKNKRGAKIIEKFCDEWVVERLLYLVLRGLNERLKLGRYRELINCIRKQKYFFFIKFYAIKGLVLKNIKYKLENKEICSFNNF